MTGGSHYRVGYRSATFLSCDCTTSDVGIGLCRSFPIPMTDYQEEATARLDKLCTHTHCPIQEGPFPPLFFDIGLGDLG